MEVGDGRHDHSERPSGHGVRPGRGGRAVAGIYRQIAGSKRYVAADLLLLPALILLTIGLAAVARRRSTAIGEVARVTALVGGALAIAQTGYRLIRPVPNPAG